MTIHSDAEDRVLLRASDVHAMERELSDLDRTISEATRKREALYDNLIAARRFLNLVSKAETAEPGQLVEDDVDLTAEVKRVLLSARQPLAHDEIRHELAKQTALERRLKESPNYYYTVIHRLISRGEIVRDGKRISISKAETQTAPSEDSDGAVNGSGVSSSGEIAGSAR